MSHTSHVLERRRAVVGAFVIGSLALAVGVVFLLGRTQSLFTPKARLHAWFHNTSGLVVGAPVRLAGVDVGVVDAIRFSSDARIKNVHVTLGIESRYLDRIREDSFARLTSKGLLGDTIIDITVGSTETRPLASGSTLRTVESRDLNELVTSLESTMSNVSDVAKTIDERVRTTFSDELARDVERLARSTAGVMEGVEHGPGLAHALIYDPRLKRDVEGTITDARRAVADATRAIDSVDRIVTRVESGPGALHGLVYRDDAGELIAHAEKAVDELASVVGEARHGHGLLHSLVYEDSDQRNLLQNLTEASRILRKLSEEVDQGKGTIGALIKDPSAYEDLKIILGNVKRNRMLRSLIRMTIVKDDLTAPAHVVP